MGQLPLGRLEEIRVLCSIQMRENQNIFKKSGYSTRVSMRPKSKTRIKVQKFKGRLVSVQDYLATEEPLELRLQAAQQTRTLAVTMRTPGNDFELAAGFLLSENVLTSRDDLKSISYCVDKTVDEAQRYNIVNLRLKGMELPDISSLERHFFTSSACGVCGRAGLEGLESRGLSRLEPSFKLGPETILNLPTKLREAQGLFELTGGLHAAALFDTSGTLLQLREDVGRHNALDKLLGWALLESRLPLSKCVLMLSGRASYELLQKALVAGIGFVCAVSAPSSLAVSLAKRFGVTLLGFVRGGTFNVYCGEERLEL